MENESTPKILDKMGILILIITTKNHQYWMEDEIVLVYNIIHL